MSAPRTLAVAVSLCSSLISTEVAAQVLSPAKHATPVRIREAPRLELATDHLAIVRWTTDNPGGSDVHLGVIHYGTDPDRLDRTATSPIRLNRGHRRTTFRVRVDDVQPRTTYYYRVSCEESGGGSDGVQSATYRFTTPGSGERITGDSRRR